MNTPICDFVHKYNENGPLRLHMPGHKGTSFLGMESLDITEFDGADNLYEANGIIAESESNAGKLFGCTSFYSTEGSSQCIRAMLYLALMQAKVKGRAPLVIAGRNVHKSFVTAAAMLDFDVDWIYSDDDSYISCRIDADFLKEKLKRSSVLPAAVYITSPDYLGMCADIRSISKVCHEFEVPLLVDNAHGAYLKFLPSSLHPMDLGADICCDSAHKTLPALTGSAYLHFSNGIMNEYVQYAKIALSLFGSTSPSYLILQSLDLLNVYLESHRQRLLNFLPNVRTLKQHLLEHGYTLYGDEVLKLSIQAKKFGYTGLSLANILKENGIVCEFADPDYLVLMLTPELGEVGLQRLESVLCMVSRRDPIDTLPPVILKGEKLMSARNAVFSPSEEIAVNDCEGRIFAGGSLACPPAIPIVVSGEKINQNMISCFRYYGIEHCRVVIE